MTLLDFAPWVLAIGASATLAIWGRHPLRMPVHWAFKPMTTLLVLGLLVDATPPSLSRTLAVVALTLSTTGDVLLMLRARWFAFGLAAFMLALMAYSTAFSLGVPFRGRSLWLAVLPLVVLAIVLKPLMARIAVALRIALTVYGLALATLAWRLMVRHEVLSLASLTYVLGVVGALLFVVGDSLLAYRRFAGARIPYALELGTYYAAQTALAVSLVLEPS